jgi:hypothetical protein
LEILLFYLEILLSGFEIILSYLKIQRLPALCRFWDLKKTALCKISVIGTVGGPLVHGIYGDLHP